MSFISIRSRIVPLAAALLLAAWMSDQAKCEETKPQVTTVTVNEMCTFCVRRITARFEKDKAIAKLTCDTKKKTVTFVPAKDSRISPRKLWEILESIGKKPQKLVGPDGTFTSKPKKL